jgi:hypothetical protein
VLDSVINASGSTWSWRWGARMLVGPPSWATLWSAIDRLPLLGVRPAVPTEPGGTARPVSPPVPARACEDAASSSREGERMLVFDGVLGLLLMALWIFCLIDVITTDEVLCRNLPKGAWVLVVLLLFDLGAVLWLIAGRTWPGAAGGADLPYRGNRGTAGTPSFPEYERPGRFAATSTEDDEEFLRRCRERAEEQRRRHRAQRRQDQAQPEEGRTTEPGPDGEPQA